jgi:Family of unknown function (DUF6644)
VFSLQASAPATGSILSFCAWLEQSAVAVLVRESLWGFQIVVALHIFGLILSVGTLVWFDLRLLGVSMRRVPVSEVYRQLAPWTAAGFVTMFVTGSLLVTAFATKAYGNTAFRIKMAAIVLAGLNALVYHVMTERRLVEWDGHERPPGAARLAGLISIVIWAVVVLAGRMISYTLYS